MGPEARIYIMIGLSLLAGALMGALLVRNGWVRAYGAVMAGHLLGATGLFVAARQGGQMQGLGYFAMLAVFVAPSMVGLGLGGVFSWWRSRSHPPA